MSFTIHMSEGSGAQAADQAVWVVAKLVTPMEFELASTIMRAMDDAAKQHGRCAYIRNGDDGGYEILFSRVQRNDDHLPPQITANSNEDAMSNATNSEGPDDGNT